MRFNVNSIAVGCLLLVVSTPTLGLIEDVIDVLHLTKEIIGAISGAWRLVDQAPLTNDIDLPFLKRKEQKILNKMSEVSQQIELTETQLINAASWSIDTITLHTKRNTKLELMLHELVDLMNRIAAQSKMLRYYTEHQDELEQSTLETTAQWIVSPNIGAVQGLLNRINLLVAGSPDLQYFGKISVIDALADELQVSKSKKKNFGI